MLSELEFFSGQPLSIPHFLINLAVGIVLAILLRWHFVKFGSTLSNRSEFAQVFPFVLLTTVIIISIVKSSIALSLGLVGALSIVRFRTPIKEPEELAYLFASIAMGIGLGANQTIATVLGCFVLLGVMAVLGSTKFGRSKEKNIYVTIELAQSGKGEETASLAEINGIFCDVVDRCDLRRFDLRDSYLEATYFVDVQTIDQLGRLSESLRERYPSAGITFLDQGKITAL